MPRRPTEEMIEELALSVGRGFKGVEQRLDHVNETIVAVEGRLADRLERIEFLLTGHEQRLSVAEDRIRQIATRLGLTFN